MTTARREYAAEEIQQMNKAGDQLIANGLDDTPEGNQHNIDLIDQFFQANPAVPVTIQTVFKAVEARKQDFKWLSRAQLEYNKVASENPAAAQELADWLATQGRQGTLVNTGEEGLRNASNLLQELRGREINTKTIQEAIGRIEAPTSKFDTRKRLPLHYVPVPRPVDPRQHQDDGEPFLGRVNVNEPNWRRISRERQEREAAEAASQQRSGASAQSALVRDAKNKAEQLRGNTHSENEQIGRVFVTVPGTSEINWPATLDARLTLQRSLNKHRETARFIR